MVFEKRETLPSELAFAQGPDTGSRVGKSSRPIPRRLPSLNAIKAFEVVARLMSYRRAASELHVTTSAVSHQIKALEEYFGIRLLRVVNRQVLLTPAGENYFRQISQGLTQLALASASLLQAKGARILRVSVAPTLATWWLIPRLNRFLTAFPDVSLEISATTVRTDFALGQYDIAIRYTKRIESGLQGVPLGKNEAFAVCSPTLLDGSFPLRKIADLQHHTLIDTKDVPSVSEPVGSWSGWFKAANRRPMAGARQITLSPRGLMLDAVAQGLGVGIARTLLAADSITAGKLVCPFGPVFPISANYHILCPETNAKDRDIAAFTEWILEEAKASTALVKRADGTVMAR